jgi:nucleoside-diphosphate-sugar epimerase
MRIFITGITGLIGKHVALRLLQENHFTITGQYFSSRNLEFFREHHIQLVQADINNREALVDSCSNCDVVVHTAARVIDFGKKEEFYQTHYYATQYLLEDAIRHGAKHFIYLSSVGVASGLPRQPQVPDESVPMVKTGIIYDDVKIDTEELVIDLCSKNKMAYTIVRPSAVVGPESVWVREPIERILKRGFFPLIDGGKHSACLIDARNLADGIYRIITNKNSHNQVYFFCDDFTEVTWKQYFTDLLGMVGKKPSLSIPYKLIYPVAVLMEAVANITGKKPLVAKKSLQAIGTDRRISTAKAKNDLGWKSVYGYPETMQYIRDWVKTQFPI